MKADSKGYGDERETIYDDRYIRARARRTSRGLLIRINKKNIFFV
jgi:hypothetical protein